MLLCAGGYGFVFVAQDVRNNKLFALKVSKGCITLVLLIYCRRRSDQCVENQYRN